MPKLFVGFDREVELPVGGCLLIDDEVRAVPDTRRPKVFDPLRHGFNPLANIDHMRAREISDILYTVFPQGESTLTVRNGKRELLQGLLTAKRLDKVDGGEEVQGVIDELFVSPVLRRVLCERSNFAFGPNAVIIARLNRKELGDFDALVIGLLLMSFYKGHIIVPDFGFYGRDLHAGMISKGQMTVGVNFLGELSPKLRNSVLSIRDKVVSGAIPEDAEALAQFTGMVPDTMEYNAFVEAAMGENQVTVV